MEKLFETSANQIAATELTFQRFLLSQIDWKQRLIMIRGGRGVGKTTLILQHIKQAFANKPTQALYVSLDQLWFSQNNICDLVDYHYKHGGTHLFLDEVHRYPRSNWQQELKNIYDSYPNYSVVLTGSSMIQLNAKVADLSRRIDIYDLPGLSFREYLSFEKKGNFKAVSLSDLLKNHVRLASEITHKHKILPLFEAYLKQGYYPFYKDLSHLLYLKRIERTISTVIDIDIPTMADIEYESRLKLKRLLVLLSEHVPFSPNITKLCSELGLSRNQLIRFIGLLHDAGIVRPLQSATSQFREAAKPSKLLFDNPDIMYALSNEANIGTLRETFAANMLNKDHTLLAPKQGDLLVNKKHTFEIGGKSKTYTQIANLPDSYILSDNLEIGFGNKIPLWMVGFLY